MNDSEFVKNNHGIHLVSPLTDLTLCGNALDGDMPELEPSATVKRAAITCERCTKIIQECRGVRVAKMKAGATHAND